MHICVCIYIMPNTVGISGVKEAFDNSQRKLQPPKHQSYHDVLGTNSYTE